MERYRERGGGFTILDYKGKEKYNFLMHNLWVKKKITTGNQPPRRLRVTSLLGGSEEAPWRLR